MTAKSSLATLESWSPYLILGLSITALGTAFASQYWGGLEPCHLCWLQRYPYMATIALGAVAALQQKARPAGNGWRLPVAASSLVFAAGASLATYHMGVEYHWWRGPESCTSNLENMADLHQMMQALIHAPIVRCDVAAWRFLGLSMAGYNLLASLGLMLISFSVIPGLLAKPRLLTKKDGSS